MNQFVSRGGIKLQAALDKFKIDIKEKIVLDVGSSTGGFVDCLVQNQMKSPILGEGGNQEFLIHLTF